MSRGGKPERFLATILFTDIVGSTDLAVRVGDRDWQRLIAAHHAAVRRQLARNGGREHDTAGDGFFASFEQPARAVRAADAILADVGALGLTLRAGIHVGECERVGDKVGGVAVNIAARVMAAAGPDEVLVSSTVRDLVQGSGLEFDNRGTHELKGVPDEWHLYSLRREGSAPADGAAAQQSAIAAVAAADAQRKSRRRRVAVGAGAIAVVGLGAVALFVFLGRSAPVLATPGPNSVVTIDQSSGALTEVRSVAAGPQAVAANADGVWVAALDSAVLVSLPLTGTEGQATTGRVGRPTGIAIGGDFVWVIDSFSQVLTLIDERSADVMTTIEDTPARQIAYGFDSAWIADDLSDSVRRLDRRSADVVAAIALPSGTYPVALSAGAGAVWVANEGTSTVSRIDPSTNAMVAEAIPLRDVPSAIAAGDGLVEDGGGLVWIASRSSDALMRLDVISGSVGLTLDDICDQPTAVAADRDGVWLGCSGPQEVWHLGRDGTVLSKASVGGEPSGIAVGSGQVYVTVRVP